jgi:hypothetical protein
MPSFEILRRKIEPQRLELGLFKNVSNHQILFINVVTFGVRISYGNCVFRLIKGGYFRQHPGR